MPVVPSETEGLQARRSRIAHLPEMQYTAGMKTISFRLPDRLVAAIDAEAKQRRVSRTDVVRERLETYTAHAAPRAAPSFRDVAGDLIGSVSGDGLPSDLSARTKDYMKAWGYGTKRDRRQRLPRGAGAAR